MIKVQVKGLDKATRKIFEGIEDLVARVSTDMLSESKRITPERSGRAKRSWRRERRGKYNVNVTNPVPYAERLDAGYSKQAPGGITRPASRKIAGKYK